MRKLFGMFVLVVFCMPFAACGKFIGSPTSPSGPSDPGRPVPIPGTPSYISPDGLVKFTLTAAMPAFGAKLNAGDRVVLQFVLENDADQAVTINNDLDGSGETIGPHTTRSDTWGSPFSPKGGPVAVINVTGHYANSNKVDWTLEIPVNWQ